MKTSLLTLLIVLSAITVLPQSASRILKSAEKAMGGAKAIKALRTIAQNGEITRVKDGAVGKFAMVASRPNLYSVKFDISGFEIEQGFNGRSGWARNSRDGLQTLTGDAGVKLQSIAMYRNNLWLNAKAEKSRIIPRGRSSVDGKAVNTVEIRSQKGVTIRVYFDAATYLPVREVISLGQDSDTFDYFDYRTVGGVKFPFAISFSDGDQAYQVKLNAIDTDQPVRPSDFDFPVASNEPIPDIPKLLAELQANEDRVEEMLDKYSYIQKITRRELTKDGMLREKNSETFQLSFYKGYRISRLIEKDGKPLSARDQASVDRDAEKRVEEIEKLVAKEDARIAKQSAVGTPSNESRRISIAEVLRASRLINPRRERFRGRDVIVFDFEPNPDFDLSRARSALKFFGKTAGVMWIDENDRQVARLEAVLFDSYKVGGGILAKLQKGASFTLEQERVNNEIWLPSQADINLSVRVLLLRGIDLNQVVRSYDYRRFETEVKDATVDTKNDR